MADTVKMCLFFTLLLKKICLPRLLKLGCELKFISVHKILSICCRMNGLKK